MYYYIGISIVDLFLVEKLWFTVVPLDRKVLAQVHSGVIRVSLVFSAKLIIHRKVNFPINMIVIFNHLLFSHEYSLSCAASIVKKYGVVFLQSCYR